MKRLSFSVTSLMIFAIAWVGLGSLRGQEKATSAATSVHMTVTLRVLGENKRMPEVRREDVIVRHGDERLKVTGWTPARGDRAGLDLFILIDDASDSSLGILLSDLRSFVSAQSRTTLIGVGYMRNGTVQIVQNFTAEHRQAADAIRLPIASSGAFGSPYLSVMDLMNRWPEGANRREVIMISDGIDRFRTGLGYRGLGFTSPDVDPAITVAQRTGTMIHTIFSRGVGRLGRNYWEITRGQNGISKLSDETGGECFFLGTQNAVSFKPYLDDVQKILENQYILEFQAIPGEKAELQFVKLTTELPGVEFDSAEAVWVKAQK